MGAGQFLIPTTLYAKHLPRYKQKIDVIVHWEANKMYKTFANIVTIFIFTSLCNEVMNL
jgi:hypothetical protein